MKTQISVCISTGWSEFLLSNRGCIRSFAIHRLLCEDWSDCMDAQADHSPCWGSTSAFVGNAMPRSLYPWHMRYMGYRVFVFSVTCLSVLCLCKLFFSIKDFSGILYLFFLEKIRLDFSCEMSAYMRCQAILSAKNIRKKFRRMSSTILLGPLPVKDNLSNSP